MKFIISIIATFLLSATSANAAIVTVSFFFQVTDSSGEAVANGLNPGTIIPAEFTYDDTATSPGPGGSILITPLTITTNIPGATFAPVIDGAALTGGVLTSLDFSIDVPNKFFMFADELSFSVEYSELQDDPDNPGEQIQVIIGGARGVILAERPEPMSEVPVPAALPLFLAGVAGVGAMRRRRHKAA